MSKNDRRPIVDRIVKIRDEHGEHECPYGKRLLAITPNLGDTVMRLNTLTDIYETMHETGECPPTTDESGEPTELWQEWQAATKFL